MNDPTWFDNPAITDQMWPATIETLLMTAWSTGLAVLIGLPLGIWLFTASKGGLNSNPVVYRVLSFIVVGAVMLVVAVRYRGGGDRDGREPTDPGPHYRRDTDPSGSGSPT